MYCIYCPDQVHNLNVYIRIPRCSACWRTLLLPFCLLASIRSQCFEGNITIVLHHGRSGALPRWDDKAGRRCSAPCNYSGATGRVFRVNVYTHIYTTHIFLVYIMFHIMFSSCLMSTTFSYPINISNLFGWNRAFKVPRLYPAFWVTVQVPKAKHT